MTRQRPASGVRRIGFLAACMAIGAARAFAALAPEERVIADWAAGQQEAMVALLEKSVRIDSATENHAGVRAVADLFGAELQAIGLKPQWIPLPAETARAGHLFAERTGTKGRRVLLVGHLDTVLHGGEFAREGNRARGVGTNDIKGGDVVLIYALKALHAAGALADTQLIVAMTGDEESVGQPVEITRRDLLDAAKRSDVTLAFETARAGEGTVARRGASSWELEVTGPTGHSSGIFSAALGSGAVYEAGRIIDALHTELRKLPGLTCNIALVAGGAEVKEAAFSLTAAGKHNIIPPRVLLRGDLRAMTPEQLVRAEAVMREVAGRNGVRTQAKLTMAHRYPPMAATPRNLELLAQFDAVSRDLGHGPVAANDPAARGAGDSAFAAPHTAVLDGLGVLGAGAHAARESVELDSLTVQAARVAVLLYRLTR